MDVKHLEGIPLLAEVSKSDLDVIARLADEVNVDPGTHLLSEGAFPHEFFILLQGTADVMRGDEQLATLGPGEFFGEIAILEEDRRTASVVTTTTCRLAVLSTPGFKEMQHAMSSVAERLRSAAEERMPR